MFKTSHKVPAKWSQSILYHEVCVTSKVLVGFSKWEQRFRAHTGHTRGTLGAPLGTGSCIALRLSLNALKHHLLFVMLSTFSLCSCL